MNNSMLMQIQEPGTSKSGLANMPLLGLGFRPFYLLAAAFAMISIPLWLLSYTGHLPDASRLDLNWHMHEMVFGFALAVIIGFLLTAARNWTGLWTLRGRPLALLAALWIAGRLAMAWLPAPLAAVVDLAFIPCAAWPLYVVIKKSGNTRNLPLLGLLTLLFLANTVFHATRLAYLDISPILCIHAAILLVTLLEIEMAGRVIPGFTANALPGSSPVINPRLNKAALILAAAASVAWMLHIPAYAAAPLALCAAVAQAWRLSGWKPWKTGRQPLLWILHLSYGWIAIGFLLLGMAELGGATLGVSSTAFHVLAVGAMSGLILGMTTRTALGHTGRLLKVNFREITMYLLLQAGTMARICANIPATGHRTLALLLAAACWSAAFLLYLVVYVPYLLNPRLDGREG
ncbi:NnrS family protein [Undibacterium sp. TJN25]|uniref:NnrS family protein n=1 Tax=Undibacterium sp. TJN25 TaxID=3413056 RepID=UPI003BEFF50B